MDEQTIDHLFKDRLVVTSSEVAYYFHVSHLTVMRHMDRDGIKPLTGTGHIYRLTREQVRRMFTQE